jgi:hypothetical protein
MAKRQMAASLLDALLEFLLVIAKLLDKVKGLLPKITGMLVVMKGPVMS